MKRILALLTVTALMLALTAMPAMAQINRPVQVNTGTLISVLNNPNVTITNVRVVNVEDSVNNNRVLNNAQVNVLQNFLNNNNVDVDVDVNNVLNNATIQGVSIQGTTLLIFV